MFAALVGTAFENGGFFSGTWTTTAVGFFWLTALALLLGVRLELSALECAWLGLLTAFVLWTALSMTWSVGSHAETLFEVRRALVYLAGVGTILLLARNGSPLYVLTAVWAAVSLVAVYALARYLFATERRPDEFQVNLLFRPLGYANALGIFAGIASILAVAFAVRAPSRALRALAAASIAPLAATVWLTSSRASALAIAVGLAATLLLDRERLQLLGGLLVVGPVAAVVVVLCDRARLTEPATVPTDAAQQARLLALWIAFAGLALALARPAVEAGGYHMARIRWPLHGRPALAAAALTSLAATLVATTRAEQFFTTGYRPGYWHVAWKEFTSHPWLGSGAGTFADYWLRYGDPNLEGGALNAHNLYLETVAEVGPAGLALLVTTLAVPLVAAARVRSHPFTAAATGAYVAFLAHAALDWDWEMPAVTLAALACAAAVLVAGRQRAPTWVLAGRARGGALALTLGLALFALAAQFVPSLGGGTFP